MSSRLDEELRRIVDEGAPPLTLDDVVGRPTLRRSAPATALLAAAVIVVIAIVVAAGVSLRSGNDVTAIRPGVVELPLSELPEGVSVRHVGWREVFVVRHRAKITVFDTDVHHLVGERGLWWCPNEEVFVSPTHAELFDRDGRAIGGPAIAGLDRIPTRVHGGTVVIGSHRLIPGPMPNLHTSLLGQGGGDWDSGPGSFCDQALKANSAARISVLYIEALQTLGFDSKEYSVPAGRLEIRYFGAAGIPFTFDDPKLRRQCELSARTTNEVDRCRVTLQPGRYLVYDPIGSHRAAGLEATIVATRR
ncbi:MAG TPA: hypothetical protein VFZ17_08880 [Acidimicrobiia bacterium]|nr:hypothetical protein [Acidimicrobiia bacterium]